MNNSALKLAVSPHIHGGRSTAGIMRDVLIALAPAAVAGSVIFGLRACLVLAICVASSVGFELLFNLIMKKDVTVGDLSAAVTGLLLGLNLPATAPLWQCVIGSLFAIVVVKCLFGGIGCNLVNPAIAARVFMLVAFGSLATPAFPTVVDAVSGATPLSAEGASVYSLSDLFFGLRGGSIGETCGAALLIGFVYILSFFVEGMDPVRALEMILSGGLLLGAIFMATDYVTSPATAAGKILFGLGAGAITVLIRYWGVYPEGVSFAILLMNILNPYIDIWTKHRVFGVGGKKA